ncbi:MAG: AIPR family protein [Chloroflexota bacterium]|nr:AIPR family protein [Chloroflexota bacterium]
MSTSTGAIAMTATDLAQLPVFLRSYDDLNSHIRETLDELDNTGKGRAFARFASRVIPLELGDRFTKVELGVDGPDGGVDLISTSADGRFVLYGQAKLTLKKAEEIELIISKFHDYYQRIHTNKVGQRYIPEIDNLPKNPDAKKSTRPSRSRGKKSDVVVIDTNDDIPVECIFVIATLSKIEGRALAEYERSSYTGRKYYDELKAAGRLIILDGSKLFPLAQSAYRKSNILPSNITLELVGNYLHQDNVYIGVISAKELKRCYKDYGEALFLDNIRLFLGYSNKNDRDNVNTSILDTAEKYPREMLARNNGITFRADTIQPIDGSDNKLYLERASIVNGCQTTKCIVDATDDTAYILVKLVATDAAWSIAKTANSQTKVDQIVLELAKYIRPQAVKMAATSAGYIVEDLHESVYDVFNSIYRAIPSPISWDSITSHRTPITQANRLRA